MGAPFLRDFRRSGDLFVLRGITGRVVVPPITIQIPHSVSISVSEAQISLCHPEARSKRAEGPNHLPLSQRSHRSSTDLSHSTHFNSITPNDLTRKRNTLSHQLLFRFPPHPQHDPIPKRRTLHQPISPARERRRSQRLTSRHIHPPRLILSSRQIQRDLSRPPPIHISRVFPVRR